MTEIAPREIPVKEIPTLPDVSIRQLNPDTESDREIAKNLDLLSLEAIHPFSHEIIDHNAAHEAMTPSQLQRWMKDRNTGMLRAIEVPDMNGENKVIGFVYLYNDRKNDPDFRRRAAECRTKNGLSENIAVWEMNFWVPEGTDDGVVRQAVQKTLEEFETAKIQRKTTMVMFADQEDITDTARMLMREGTLDKMSEKPPSKIAARDILQRLSEGSGEKGTVENAFQDTRVLKDLGFKPDGETKYGSRDKLSDLMYTRLIPHGKRNPIPSPPRMR